MVNNFNKAYSADWKSTYFLQKKTHQERDLEVQ